MYFYIDSWLPTDSTSCQPMPPVAKPPIADDREIARLAPVGSRWNRLAAGRIGWQPVESVGNGKTLYFRKYVNLVGAKVFFCQGYSILNFVSGIRAAVSHV